MAGHGETRARGAIRYGRGPRFGGAEVADDPRPR